MFSSTLRTTARTVCRVTTSASTSTSASHIRLFSSSTQWLSDTSRTLFVGNVHTATPQSEILQVLGALGEPPIHVRRPRKPASFCHIAYATPEQAQAALAKASTTKVRVGGKQVKIGPSEDRKIIPSQYVFVTGLPDAGSSQGVAEALGVSADAVQIVSPTSAVVNVEDVKRAAKIVAQAEKGDLALSGRQLYADYSSKPPPEPTHELLLSSSRGGSLSVTKLKQAFWDFRREVKDIRPLKQQSDSSRFFITFKDSDSATHALKVLNGKVIDEEPVFLVYAHPRKSLA